MIINTRTGALRYSNAGHPHSIVFRKSGKMELLKSGGPAIGIGDLPLLNRQKNRYAEGRLHMGAGDRLFIYTDGIVDYQNPKGEFYGTDRFYQTLEALQGESVAGIVEKAVGSLMDFGHMAEPLDDITLLGLEIKKTATKG